MNVKRRIVIGFMIGCCLSMFAALLAGAGHGTYVPLVVSSSVLVFLPGIGIRVAFFAAPVLWAVYLVLIPTIQRTRAKAIGIASVFGMHVLPAAVFALAEPAFATALREVRPFLAAFFVLALVAFLALVVLSIFHPKKASAEFPSKVEVTAHPPA
jgi:hypothetical protein